MIFAIDNAIYNILCTQIIPPYKYKVKSWLKGIYLLMKQMSVSAIILINAENMLGSYPHFVLSE